MDILPRSFYNRDTLTVARDLLGQYLVRVLPDGQRLVCRITETEAYVGPVDKACHAYGYKRTPRTETLFAPPGTAYLYLIYGMYHCLNLVTEPEGEPCAVLIRGAQAVANGDIIAKNRFGCKMDAMTAYQKKNFLNGPGKLCRGLLLQDERPYVLLIGAESLSQITDFQDRSTCILFGDGAGAAVLTLEENRLYAGIQGARGETTITIGGDRDKRPLIHMDGQAVFRFAVESFVRAANTLTQRTGVTLDQIDWFIPHQANRRIVEAAAKHLKQPLEKFYLNIDRYGNTSAASIPIAMDEMQEKGLLQRGQKVLCAAFGSGLTWGGALLEF